MDISLARTEVPALNCVVEESVGAVAIVLVILRGIDAALRGDGVRAARAVLITEALYVVALFRQRRGGRSPSQPRTNNNDVKLPLVSWAHKLRVVFIGRPLVVEGTCGNVCVGCHCANPFPNPKT